MARRYPRGCRHEEASRQGRSEGLTKAVSRPGDLSPKLAGRDPTGLVDDLEEALVVLLDFGYTESHPSNLGAVSVWAILAAAGSGERLGLDRPKAFAPLNDRPLIAEPLERLDASEWIEGIVVAAPPEWEEPCILVAEEVAAGKVAGTVTGGATRSESVQAALAEVPEEATVVLVHDAARPFVVDEVIERVIKALGDGWDGAVPVLPISDTVKRVEGEAVAETLDREGLVTAQTPQAFVAPALRDAFTTLEQTVTKSTDCASLVEANGGRVRAVEGDTRLLKVTTPADLELVASWL